MELTFDNLPKAVTDIQEAVNDIKKLLLEKKAFLDPQSETLLTVKDAAQFLTLSVPTIYSLISKPIDGSFIRMCSSAPAYSK